MGCLTGYLIGSYKIDVSAFLIHTNECTWLNIDNTNFAGGAGVGLGVGVGYCVNSVILVITSKHGQL